MTFNQIIWKMAKVQYKKYIFYFLSNSFVVMFFFMFSTVYFNIHIVEIDGIKDVLLIPAVALIVFTIFFISYAHNIFMKRRRSEFGLFLTLGMSQRDICKLLLIENGVIAISSLVSGILAGTVFSRLFFMILMNSIGLKEVPFHLNGKMFFYSVSAFLIVFLIAIGYSLFVILRRNVIHSMKSNRVAETIKIRSPLLGGLGLIVMVGSILMLYYTFTNISGGYLLLWTATLLLGLYVSLNQITSFLIELAKKYPPFYYRRLLSLSSLDYKFKQLTSLLMLVTIMIMITIFYSTLLLTFYKSSEKEAIENNPYDLAYIQTETKNNLSNEELYGILDQKEHPIQKHLVIPIYNYYDQNDSYWDGYNSYTFMSLEHFNELTSGKRTLADKKYLYFVNADPEFVDSNEYMQELTLPLNDDKKTFKMKELVVKKHINSLSNAYEFIIVNKSEYKLLKESLNGFESTLQLINMANWKETKYAVDDLKERLNSYNKSTPPMNGILSEYYSEEDLFQVASKIDDYHYNKNTNGILFFVITFLSIMFFFGTFILLYLNLFSEIDVEKDKYRKLYKIGITLKEVKRNITSELITIFFIPTILGMTLAFIYIVILSTDVGGITKNFDILVHFLIIAGTYLCIQVGYFLYARKKMLFHLIEQ